MNFRRFFTTHTWWGKLIGAFLGYLIGGSAGALLGILIGNLFDRGLAEHFSRPYWQYHAENRKKVQNIFFHATFAVMGYVAKSDGRVSEQEILMARTLMQEMRLKAEQKRAARIYFNEGKSEQFNLSAVLAELKAYAHDNPELLRLFIDIQYRASRIEGFNRQKIQALDKVLGYLGFAPLNSQYRYYEDAFRSSQRQSQHQHRPYSHTRPPGYQSSNALEHAFAILEINSNSNKQEVKRAYPRLMSRNHPDKLIAQGLPEEMIRLGNDKTQKIRKAYEQICEIKGW